MDHGRRSHRAKLASQRCTSDLNGAKPRREKRENKRPVKTREDLGPRGEHLEFTHDDDETLMAISLLTRSSTPWSPVTSSSFSWSRGLKTVAGLGPSAQRETTSCRAETAIEVGCVRGKAAPGSGPESRGQVSLYAAAEATGRSGRPDEEPDLPRRCRPARRGHADDSGQSARLALCLEPELD
jgi:hypothetical protein